MADKNKDGYDDADVNKDGLVTNQEQSQYDLEQQSAMTADAAGDFLPPVTGEDGGSVVTGSTGSEILWSTAGSKQTLKNKTQVKNAYLTRTLEPQFLNQIDAAYNNYGKALGFKSAASFWNNVVEQSDTKTTPWKILKDVKAAVDAGVTPPPGGGKQLSATERAAQKELKAMQVALAADPEADLVGEPGKFQETLTKYSDSMGLLKSRKEVNSYVKGIVEGKLAADAVTDEMRKQATVLYSNFADRLNANPALTVRDLVNPYLQVMADTLEIDPQLVKLTDPTIQNAISGTKLRSLTDFRNDMRNDSRFATTRTAKREATDLAQSLLRGFGFSL